MTQSEKSGVISSIEETTASNGNELFRIIVSTATAISLDALGDDVTAFLLSQNEQTEFSVLMPKNGLELAKVEAALVSKTVQIVVFAESVQALSKDTISAIRYTRNDGTQRITRQLKRTYLKGSQNADARTAFDAMQDELRTRLEDGTFEVVTDSEPAPAKPATPAKPKVEVPF